MRYVVAIAASAALIGCTGQKADTNVSANAAAPAADGATGNASGAGGLDYGRAGPPPAAYAAYFNQRWSEAGRPVTPAEVLDLIGRVGPQQAVNQLNDNGQDRRWETVSSGIAKGDPAWLAIAPRIGEGTDAGTSIDFMVAVQDAVTTNPAGALRLMTQLGDGTGFCNEHGMEVPAAQARAYFQTAMAAVEGVADPSLQQAKAGCLAELRKGMVEYPGVGAGSQPQP
jgi:hypothetical protein